MEHFAALVDALVYTRSRNGKLALIAEYLRETPDPDRGWALAALTEGLSFAAVKPAAIRALDDRAGRSGAVRAEPRFRRRYRGDRELAVAGAGMVTTRRHQLSVKLLIYLVK